MPNPIRQRCTDPGADPMRTRKDEPLDRVSLTQLAHLGERNEGHNAALTRHDQHATPAASAMSATRPTNSGSLTWANTPHPARERRAPLYPKRCTLILASKVNIALTCANCAPGAIRTRDTRFRRMANHRTPLTWPAEMLAHSAVDARAPGSTRTRCGPGRVEQAHFRSVEVSLVSGSPDQSVPPEPLRPAAGRHSVSSGRGGAGVERHLRGPAGPPQRSRAPSGPSGS